METIFQAKLSWKRATTPKIIGGFHPQLNLTVLYNCTPVYRIWIQYNNIFNRSLMETIFQAKIMLKLKKGSRNNCCILPKTETYLYFMIIYLCTKYESNTVSFSKDNERKPFSYGTDWQTYICMYSDVPPPPI